MQDLSKFEIENRVKIEKNQAGLEKIYIHNELAEAEIYLLGANITHFCPKGEEDILFDGLSTRVYADKTLHAGIPICWPWFGPHPTDITKPQHGFARSKVWRIKNIVELSNKETSVVLTLNEDSDTLKLFAHAFELEISFTIGSKLRVELTTINKSNESFTLTQALHSYFKISDIDEVVIMGVENQNFVDYTNANKIETQEETLRIDRILNRVYIPSTTNCEIVDRGLNRIILIQKEHSNSTTIWNPGPNSGLHDVQGDKYREFVCIETTNAREDRIILQPNASCSLVQIIGYK